MTTTSCVAESQPVSHLDHRFTDDNYGAHAHFYTPYPPRVGQKALCGHVKPDTSLRPRYDLPLCVVCADLYPSAAANYYRVNGR